MLENCRITFSVHSIIFYLYYLLPFEKHLFISSIRHDFALSEDMNMNLRHEKQSISA